MKEVKGLILDENFKERNSVVGKQIGEIKILKVVGYTTELSNLRVTKNTVYECQCECGEIFQGRARDIKQKKILSCGCRKKENATKMGKNNFLGEKVSGTNVLYYRYKRRAVENNMSFSLDLEKFKDLTSQNCFYCGAEPEREIAENYSKLIRGKYKFNGLDRVDNNIGYEENNVVPCCFTCNRAKLNLTSKLFNEWIQRLIEYQNKGLFTSQTLQKEKEEII